MKKLLAILISAVFVLSLSACGNDLDGGLEKGSIPTKNESGVSSLIPDASEEANISVLPGGTITRDKAIEIALRHAKFDKNSVFNIAADFDSEIGGYEWDVDFDYGGYEYSYDIDAETGEIINSQKEIDD